MKQQFFKVSKNILKITNIESVRTGLYQFSGILIIVLFSLVFFVLISLVITKSPLQNGLFMIKNPIFLIIFAGIPAAAIIFAQRFPPAPVVTFHSDSQNVQWSCGKERLVVPFQKITFSPVRMPSKSGISNVFVMVTAVDNKPFFENETVSNQPGARYKKDLCLYKAGTQDEADESIEIIRKFMSGKLEKEDSFRL